MIKGKDGEKEIFVHPKHAEHAFDFDFWRDNNKLWALNIPVEEMSIDELKWIMDVPFWEDEAGNIVITPNQVLKNPDQYPDHREKISSCDTSFPLHIMKNKNGKWLTLDGLHRLTKLFVNGAKLVQVKKVPPEMVPLTKRDE
jgi:hypothetical protein